MQAVGNEGGKAYGDLSVFIMHHQASLHLLSASEAQNKSGKSCLIVGIGDVAWKTPNCMLIPIIVLTERFAFPCYISATLASR